MKRAGVLAYTAGIIDGEGSIQITRTKRIDSKQGTCLEMRVLVGNTKQWLCEWLKMQFGGSVSSWKAQKLNWNQTYVWKLSGKKASEFLRILRPYLQLKGEQAELAIKFQSATSRDSEGLALREAQRILMRSMNTQRGGS